MKMRKEPDPHKPLTSKEFKAMGPWLRTHELPEELQRVIRNSQKMGRPKLEQPKQKVTIRLDQDILATFRAKGKGWQTQLNALLRNAMAEGRV